MDQEIRVNVMRMDHFQWFITWGNTALGLDSEICMIDWEQVLRAVGQHFMKCGGLQGSETLRSGSQFIRLKVFHHHTQGAIHILNY